VTTGALGSLLRAAGVVKWPAFITVFAFYGIGLPLGAYLTFGPPNRHSIYSLWLGLFIGMSSMLVGLSICFYHVDFEQAAKDARERSLATASNPSGKLDATSTSTSSPPSAQKGMVSSAVKNVLVLTHQQLSTTDVDDGEFELDDDEMEDVLRDLEVAIEKADSYKAPSRNLYEEELSKEDSVSSRDDDDNDDDDSRHIRSFSQSSEEYYDYDMTEHGDSDTEPISGIKSSPKKHVYNKINVPLSFKKQIASKNYKSAIL
jgi:hypothetical protein